MAKGGMGGKRAKSDNFSYVTKIDFNKMSLEAGNTDYFSDMALKNFQNGYIGTNNAMKINDALRNDKKLSKEQKKTVNLLQSEIDSHTISKSIVGDRYVDESFLTSVFGTTDVGKIKSGTTFSDKAFTSISLVKGDNVFTKRSVKLKVQVPKGTHGFVTGNFKESELILGMNSQFKVINATKNKGKTEITIRYVG